MRHGPEEIGRGPVDGLGEEKESRKRSVWAHLNARINRLVVHDSINLNGDVNEKCNDCSCAGCAGAVGRM